MPLQDAGARARNFDEVALGYTPKMAVEEAARCLGCKNSPCVAGCPVCIRIPDFIARIREGEFEQAYQIIRRDNALPAVCGRVCAQETQCECRCVRGVKGEAVAIGPLERFAADYHRRHAPEKAGESVEPAGEKAAVIGAGPAGLTCAGELAGRGYAVTVFEALHAPGGVLTYGIPEFRLPKKIVSDEIRELTESGVQIRTNEIVGRTVTVDELFEQGYRSVFIGSGAGLPSFLNIEGENLNGVYSANEYLTRTNLMKAYSERYDTPIRHSRNVAVIGGGNVAMDAARCALRLGADSVTVVYRRTADKMPARKAEIEHAREEGVDFLFSSVPVRFIGGADGNLLSLVCGTRELGEWEEFSVDVDTAIVAVGTTPNPLLRKTTPHLAFGKKGCIAADGQTGLTSRDGVYAGGDAVTGAATVIQAMGAGKKAAEAMDEYMRSL